MKSFAQTFSLSILLLCALLVPLSALAQAPTVSGVTPTSGIAGTQVTFTGAGFGATQGSGNVWLGSTSARVT